MSERDTTTYHDFLKDFQPGVFLGTRYTILKTIGAGGMGRVFLAHDGELDVDVALKVIRPELLQSGKALDRFKNELLVARKVSHKNVVRIHDIGEVSGLKYLTMTYIPGMSLKEALRSSGNLPIDRAIPIFTQICEGVSAAHAEDVIHRDLKPANVMLDENDRVYLTDFGIAKWLEAPDETASDVLIGTPAYLSPEQTWGERPDARSDIYALGLILYELLCGTLPFDHETSVSFKTRLPASLPKNVRQSQPDIPRFLISMIQKCLEPNRSARYQTVGAIIQDLQSRTVAARTNLRRVVVAAASIAVLAAGVSLAPRFFRAEPAAVVRATTPKNETAGHAIVVLPFQNKTGRQDMAWVESTLGDLLITDLGQAPGLRVLNSDRVFQTMQDLKMQAASYEQSDANNIGEILGGEFVVSGSVAQAGSTLRLDAQVKSLKQPDRISYFKALGSKQGDLLSMVDALAHQIQTKISTNPSGSTQNIAQMTTSSIDALKLYQQAVQMFRKGDFEQATEGLQESIQKDPKFAVAYWKLALAYEESGREEDAAAILQKGIDAGARGDAKTESLIRAEQAVLQNDSQKAISILQNLGSRYPNDPDVLLDQASVYEQMDDREHAVAALQKVVQIDPNQADAFFRLGKNTILMGKAELAISQYLIKALSLQTQTKNRQGQADVLNAMGVAYERLGRYDDALKYYSDSLSIKEEIGNKQSATISLTNIANLYVFQSQFEKAKEILKKAQIVYREINDPAGVAEVQNTFGVISENQGQYEDALKYYRAALQIRKTLKDDRLIATSYENIGQIYYLTGHYDEAQAFDEQSLALRRKTGDQNGIILSMQNMGFLQLAQGDLNEAVKSFLDALQQARAIQFENAIAVSLGNLGTIFQAQGRYDAALDSYREAINVLKGLNDRKGESEYTKLMGATFLEMGNFTDARASLNSAREMAEQMSNDELLTDVNVLLGKLHRLQNHFQEGEEAVNQAMLIASKNKYQKGILAAQMEKGILTGSDSTLIEIQNKAAELGDVWLKIDSQYALANVYLRNQKPQKAIQLCQQAIPPATKMGIAPYLIRFYSIEGQAYANLKDQRRSAACFQHAAELLKQLRKEMKPQYFADFENLQEVRVTGLQNDEKTE